MSSPDMPRRDQVLYVKEEILNGIDSKYERMRDDGLLDAIDDEAEYVRQRNRVARFLGLPEVRL
jgi:hypothetical protein